MNTFMNAMSNTSNYTVTENGALAHKTTNSAVYDMFALGAAMRNRPIADIVLKFKNAYEEDKKLALKCLFYIGDCRGGQGERRFFRACYSWLASQHPSVAIKLLRTIPFYRRWDDLLYVSIGNKEVWEAAMSLVRDQLADDIMSKTPSLLAKWLPSENASSAETKRVANAVRTSLHWSHRQYRKTLSVLRGQIKVLEKTMSANDWDKIEFDKLPAKAGLKYSKAFARRAETALRYAEFMSSKTTKVNAGTLYPYEIAHKALDNMWFDLSHPVREAINKYWENLPDYFNGKSASMMCVVDTSGSMQGTPIEVATSLGMYCAERLNGPFKDHFISFSSRPKLIKVEGVDFVDKARRIAKQNLCENTDLVAVFDLLKGIALRPDVRKSDVPKTIVVISDMEIDNGTGNFRNGKNRRWTAESAPTEMEKVRQDWVACGLEMPRLIYWNVDARHDTILDAGPNVSFVSGCSPVIFENILTGKNGYDLMLEKLMSERYAPITVD